VTAQTTIEPTAISGTRRQYKEMADGTLRVQIDIDPAFKKIFLELFPTIDMPVAIAPLRADFERIITGIDLAIPNGEETVSYGPGGEIRRVQNKPYGKEAAELYRIGFFYNPKVLEAIGTDAEFLEWIRQQPCAMTGEFDRNEDGQGNFIERCEAAHFRAIADGAGAGLKPPYSAIPLVHAWHEGQSRWGYGVFDTDNPHTINDKDGDPTLGYAWMGRQRNHYVVIWASSRLAYHLKRESMGYVEPSILLEWADAHDLQMFLPAVYK